ncbi:MAG: 2-oxoglutarate dehydrogenase E1 component [Phycisphaerales bacterium]
MSAGATPVPHSVNSWNAEYLESEYQRFRQDPASVSPAMADFFRGFDLALGLAPERVTALRPSPGADGGANHIAIPEAPPADTPLRFQTAVNDLVEAYRSLGHLGATLDPFGRERERSKSLSLEHWGLSPQDLDRPCDGTGVGLSASEPLRNVIDLLEHRYCRSIGVEFAHIQDTDERDWIKAHYEHPDTHAEFSRKEKAHLLELLIKSELFEQFIQKRYPGEKRFSLEGAESLIPLLDHMIEHGASLGVVECVLGMAHRGRLNVLNSILGKTEAQIFTEFEDAWAEDFADGGGDVKYHRGYSGTRTFVSGAKVHLAMASNPSHLEAVDGVVLGRTRAKQRLRGDHERTQVVPIIIHGDAAIAGQGVVAECANLSQLEGYTTGGCVHIVVNNLIGFTTTPQDGRTSRYCTDVAKITESPVFHVNAEDPEAIVRVARLAIEYRQKFRKDVYIDQWCYRRYGHNEQDEPSFTQPIVAALIKDKKSIMRAYASRLYEQGVLTDNDVKAIRTRINKALDDAQATVKKTPFDPTIDPGSARWAGMGREFRFDQVVTGVPMETIREVAEALGRVPDDFHLNPKLAKLLKSRREIPDSGELSHADAELLAFGTLLIEGTAVRLSGQDCRRGTFSQRHAVLRDFQTAEAFIPLNAIREMGQYASDTPPGSIGADGKARQTRFCVYDSPLSEFAVMAFDYGYSLADPSMFVLWEAQFGDFANGAQVIIDQFLATAESKWQRWSGLTLLLPHGYEGAGPEHSSCRIERFLQLCADSNLQVAYPTTGAQVFHLLRRQMKRQFRKPLIVATPKSMLRVTTAHVGEITRGSFQEILDDPAFAKGQNPGDRPFMLANDARVGDAPLDHDGVKRILLCTGKVYWELAARRHEIGRTDTAIVRLEQIHPLHDALLSDIMKRYPNFTELCWVQEEPRNQGAYHFVADRLRTRLGVRDFTYIGRPEMPSTATGSKKKDRQQQEEILSAAIGPAQKPDAGDKPAKPAPKAKAATAA